MLQALLGLFTTAEKAEAMLESPIIRLIFFSLFGLFAITLAVHFTLYVKIKKTRHYVQETKRFGMEPLKSIKEEFGTRQQKEAIKPETFVQEKFSGWRMAGIPVVNLIKLVQMTISIFILLGVLGTFIGLTISLGSISTESEALVENISGVLSGIDVAFYTSIIGMSFSLIMTVLVRAFSTEYLLTDLMLMVESHLESEEQHGMGRMIDALGKIHGAILHMEKANNESLGSIVKAFSGFKDYTAGLEQSAKDLAAFNDGLSGNLEEFKDLFGQMKVITEGFGEGTTKLNNNFDTLFTHFKKADDKNERMLTTFDKTYANIEKVSDAQIGSLQNFDTSVSDLKDFTSSILDAQSDVRGSLENITNKAEGIADTMGAHNQTFKKLFGEDVSARLYSIATYLADLNKGFDKIDASISSLPEALTFIKETQDEHKHLLEDRFREVKEFNQTFGDHLKRHESETRSFEKHLRDTAGTFELLANKNNALVNEINRSISQANQSFSERNQSLHSNVADMKNTLTTHVSGIENTLGQKLDTLIRNMDQSLYTAVDGMNRELAEIRRMSEDVSQNNARLIQQVLQEFSREMQALNRRMTPSGGEMRVPNRSLGMNRDEY